MQTVSSRGRLPVAGIAVGSLAGVLLAANRHVFETYVGSLLGLLDGGTALQPGHPGVALSLGVAFLVGLSMNFLPCNLPVVMSLLPATAGAETRTAFARRTALYAAGALAVLGVLGFALGLAGETVRPLLERSRSVAPAVAALVIGGVGLVSVLWGLREFDLLSPPGAPVSVTNALRGAVDEWEGAGEYVVLGAVYGGTGGGCPLPTYHLLLLWVAVAADPVYGAVLLGTYVLGRVLPVAVLGAVFRERPRSAMSVFSGGYDHLRTVNGTLLVTGGSLLVVFTGLRALTEVIR